VVSEPCLACVLTALRGPHHPPRSLADGRALQPPGRPQPLCLGVAFALLGLLLSVFFVRDSDGHARAEATVLRAGDSPAEGRQPSFRTIFLDVSLKDRALSSASQAGMINNLNDGMAWGLFPLYFAASGLPLGQLGRSSCDSSSTGRPPRARR
jgi:hypothetical protein